MEPQPTPEPAPKRRYFHVTHRDALDDTGMPWVIHEAGTDRDQLLGQFATQALAEDVAKRVARQHQELGGLAEVIVHERHTNTIDHRDTYGEDPREIPG